MNKQRRALAWALLVLGWGFLLWLAMASRVVVVRAPGSLRGLAEEHRLVLPLLGVAVLLVSALLLERWAGPCEVAPPPRGVGSALARGVATSAFLSGGLALYLAAGGEDIFWYYRWAPVGTAALVGPPLGLLMLLEGPAARAAPRVRRAGWALLAFALAFAALVLAWAQREYVNELFLRGLVRALRHASKQLPWFTSEPYWTFRHYAWIGVPAAVTLLVRSEPKGERVARALAWVGVGSGLWLCLDVAAGDSVILVTNALLCLVIPLAARTGDRALDWLGRRLDLVR
ncbi:MAG: hypothetical protein AB7N76_18760 [Planctomycetota bacterium]